MPGKEAAARVAWLLERVGLLLNMPGVTRMSFPAVSASVSACSRVGIESESDHCRRSRLGADVSIRGQIINLLLDLQRDFALRICLSPTIWPW